LFVTNIYSHCCKAILAHALALGDEPGIHEIHLAATVVAGRATGAGWVTTRERIIRVNAVRSNPADLSVFESLEELNSDH
jgi:hypothetical protein